MTKLIHNITVTVFEKNEEQLASHKKVFRFLLPVDFKKQKVEESIETVEGFHQKPISILRLKTKKSSHNKQLLDQVFSHLDEKDKNRIGSQYLSRLNREGYFFLRFKKKDLVKKKFVLTESGDCYHFKIKIAGFPAKWEEFEKSTKSLLIKYNCLERKKRK